MQRTWATERQKGATERGAIQSQRDRNVRVVTNARDPLDSPKQVVVRKFVNCIDDLSHSKIITDSNCSFANSVRPFAFNFRLHADIRI